MAMICDACGAKYGRDDGNATLHTTPPRPDFKLFQAFTAAGQPYVHREPLTLDLCLACTKKALAHLGLPTDSCELPELPKTSEGGEGSPMLTEEELRQRGALTEEDLRQLGMTEEDLRQLGVPKG
jgi:hypothetical protein